jgi:hypothetical protein
VRYRNAEHPNDRVANVFLDAATVSLDDRPHLAEVAAE